MRHSSSRIALLALSLGLLPSLAGADQLLTVEIQRKSYDTQLEHFTKRPDPGEKNLASLETYETRILLGTGRARIDRGDKESWIYLAREKKLIHLHHETRDYEVFPLPVNLAEHLDGAQMARVQDRIAKMKPAIEVDHTGETRQVGRWKGRKAVLKIQHAAEGTRKIELWLSEELGVDLTPYRELVLARSQLFPWTAEWARAEIALAGFPVLWGMEYRVATVRLSDHRRLLSIEDVEPPASTYAPPPEYAQITDIWAQYRP